MAHPQTDFRDCFLCRVMRGMALGGFGAALFGLPAKWLGAPADQVPYYALFGALLITAWLTRKPPPRN
jgi:hypothetical protein